MHFLNSACVPGFYFHSQQAKRWPGAKSAYPGLFCLLVKEILYSIAFSAIDLLWHLGSH